MSLFTQETIYDRNKKMANSAFGLTATSVRAIANHVWKTKGKTPQEVLDGYGTDAAKLVTFGLALAPLLGVEIVPEGCTVVANPDGTATATWPEPPAETPEPSTSSSSSSSDIETVQSVGGV